ncbi:MAG TPA: hypothetical protein VGL12_05765 [Roseiarcus sp.]
MRRSERSINLTYLRSAGFKRIGYWEFTRNSTLKLKKTRRFDEKTPAIYLFVIKGTIHYVGKSEGIQARFTQYVRGVTKGNRKVDKGIVDALNDGDEVGVYILAIPKQQMFWKKGLPVYFLSCLEDGLIKHVESTWNRREKDNIAPSV